MSARHEVSGEISGAAIRAAAGRYAASLLAARRRFLRVAGGTAAEVRRVYLSAAEAVRADILRATGGTLRQRHLSALEGALAERARAISDGVLAALTRGIRLSLREAIRPIAAIGQDRMGDVFGRANIERLYAETNERALAALLTRTQHPDGLVLSDRVWRTGQTAQKAVARVLEDAVARQQSSHETARQLQRYLQPGVHTPLKRETQRRLGVPQDVSMEAMRLAVTETNNAYREGIANAVAASPWASGIIWRLSSRHTVPDICDRYAAHNGNGFWPTGSIPASPHPWCWCVMLPVVGEPDAFRQRLRRWLDDPQADPAMEDWYQRFGLDLPRPGPETAGGGDDDK